MEQPFLFQTTPLDPRVQPQLSRALRQQTELRSRQKHPKLWKLTDRLTHGEKAPQAVLEKRKKRHKFLGVLNWLLGSILLMTGLVPPRMLLLLLVGAAGFGAGVAALWRNGRTLLGALILLEGIFLSVAGMGDLKKMGALLILGIACLVLGIAALITGKRAGETYFDREARRLLQSYSKPGTGEGMQVSFLETGMTILRKHETEESLVVPYGLFALVVETEDLLLPVLGDTMVVLQKKDLCTGPFAQLREFLQGQTRYIPASENGQSVLPT